MLVAALLAVYAAQGAGGRRIGWWWDAPATASDPEVDALLSWVANHTDVTTSILMRCGPTTLSGAIEGALLPSCARVIPGLAKLGVESELWLGETDSAAAAGKLVADPDTAASTLQQLGKANPGITGFNFDLEVAGASPTSASDYAAFLSALRTKLGGKWRVTADGACGGSWAPIIGGPGACKALAGGADKVLNMRTYNAGSFAQWKSYFDATLDVPRDSIGAGLGCYIDGSTNNTWATTPESAEQRVCTLLNNSFTEIDMFRVAPTLGWPQPWWIPQLQKFMQGGGCVPSPAPEPSNDCPLKGDGWTPSTPGCCTTTYAAVDMKKCATQNHTACAQQQCESSTTKIDHWVPLNYSSHPYTCCSSAGPTPPGPGPTPPGPTPPGPTPSGGTPTCAAAGQAALCSVACKSTCRGFAPGFGAAGCAAQADCTAPPAWAKGSVCTC